MSKIQILNETQVKHFVEALRPELETKFDARVAELEEQAKKEKDNFATHAEIIELKEKQEKNVDKARKTIEVAKLLKDIDEDYVIKNANYWGHSVYSTEEEVESLLKEYKKAIEDKLLDLSEKKLNVNAHYMRKDQMMNDLKARLSMTAVASFDEIKKVILEAIDINSYFSYTI